MTGSASTEVEAFRRIVQHRPGVMLGAVGTISAAVRMVSCESCLPRRIRGDFGARICSLFTEFTEFTEFDRSSSRQL